MALDEPIDDEVVFFTPRPSIERRPGLASRIKALFGSLLGRRGRSQAPSGQAEEHDYLSPVEIVRIRFSPREKAPRASVADVASSGFLAFRVFVRSLIAIAVLFGLGYLLLMLS